MPLFLPSVDSGIQGGELVDVERSEVVFGAGLRRHGGRMFGRRRWGGLEMIIALMEMDFTGAWVLVPS